MKITAVLPPIISPKYTPEADIPKAIYADSIEMNGIMNKPREANTRSAQSNPLIIAKGIEIEMAGSAKDPTNLRKGCSTSPWIVPVSNSPKTGISNNQAIPNTVINTALRQSFKSIMDIVFVVHVRLTT